MTTGATHLPWVGPAFADAAPRLLLLGDSHYVSDPGDDSLNLTRDIVRDVRDGVRSFPFYSKVAELVRPILSESLDRVGFWNRVAFFNFVPVVVGATSDAIPTPQMWLDGGPRFFAFLAEHQPTHVLSLGQRQWNHIRFPGGWSSAPAPDAADPEIRNWNGPAGEWIVATWINHPSSRGFSTTQWQPRVAALLG